MSPPPGFAVSSALVALGGGFGAWARLITSRLWLAGIGPVAASAFPWATLTANVLGSFAMGLLVGWMARHGGTSSVMGPEHWRLLLGVGVLGGYTTFSAFALEFALFTQRGQIGLAALYVAVSLVAGFAAMFAGLLTMRGLA